MKTFLLTSAGIAPEKMFMGPHLVDYNQQLDNYQQQNIIDYDVYLVLSAPYFGALSNVPLGVDNTRIFGGNKDTQRLRHA